MDWDIFGIVAIVLIIYVIAGVGAAIHYKRHPVNPKDFEKGNTLPQKILHVYLKAVGFLIVTLVAIIAILGIILIVWLIIKNL